MKINVNKTPSSYATPRGYAGSGELPRGERGLASPRCITPLNIFKGVLIILNKKADFNKLGELVKTTLKITQFNF